MRHLELDFCQRGDTHRWFAIALLALAVVLGLKQLHLYAGAKQEIAQLEERVSRLNSRDIPATASSLPNSIVQEIRRANLVIERIAFPWDQLFRAFEAAGGERVALLAITPDPKSGGIEVSAEAGDLNAMLGYVKRLQGQPALSRVFLLTHKINHQHPQRPINFTVTASWLERTSGL